MIDRLEYLARTLSRTKRKDFENYVINAVWNRLDAATRSKLKPVSQQAIRAQNGSLYYIDLFFPQLNLAVECDEIFHTNQLDADQIRQESIRRTLAPDQVDIFATITAIAETECEFRRIPVPANDRMFEADAEKDAVHRELTIEAIDRHIEECVATIHNKSEHIDPHAWDELDAQRSPATYYANRTKITVEDGVIFSSIAELCNVLVGTRYKAGRTRSFFTPATLRRTRGSERDLSQHKIWCPKNLAAAGAKSEWTNKLSASGDEISERQAGVIDRSVSLSPTSHPRLTFLRVRDEVTGERGLRFVGIFERDRVEGDTVIYRRKDTVFALPHVQSRVS